MKEFYPSLMEFIESTDNNELESLIISFENLDEILNEKVGMISILQLLSIIADNHHRSPDFINNFEKIFSYLIPKIHSQVSDSEIYQIFKNNKRVLLLLFEKEFIQPDEDILSDIMISTDENKFPYCHYLYSGIKSFIDKDQLKTLENEIKEKYDEDICTFEEKCRIGENDGYLCSLIRNDSIVEFISHVNRNNISLSSKILPSIFETNKFLINKTTSLAEYAAFFGSIQIIQYLKSSKVILTDIIWLYAIHSNEAELINFVEQNVNILLIITYEKIFEESICCHHNGIADYINNTFLNQSQDDDFESCFLKSCNYQYITADINEIISRPRNWSGFRISHLCFSLKQITIPSSVTLIGDYSFFECSSLKKVSIPSSVTSIGDYSFCKCTSLIEMSIPSSVTSIGKNAFSDCSSLEIVSIPESVTLIKDNTFRGCSSLKHMIISSSVKSIGEESFAGCSSLIEIIIPSSVTSIKKGAFRGCKSLMKINIPSSVNSIKDSVFRDCTSLKQILIPSSIKCIGNRSFKRCSSLVKISIPLSVKSIGCYAFEGCHSLNKITIPSSVKIGSNAFDDCSSLTKIDLSSPIYSYQIIIIIIILIIYYFSIDIN